MSKKKIELTEQEKEQLMAHALEQKRRIEKLSAEAQPFYDELEDLLKRSEEAGFKLVMRQINFEGGAMALDPKSYKGADFQFIYVK